MKVTEMEFPALFEKYKTTVYSVAFHYVRNCEDAADIEQDVFPKLLSGGMEYESEEHMKAWLIRVTVNACRDLLKSFSRKNTVSIEDLRDYMQDITPEKYAVMEAVRSLPKPYRDVIYLHFYEGYTAPEIAGILNRNPNTVYTHLRKGKDLLKELLGGVLNG